MTYKFVLLLIALAFSPAPLPAAPTNAPGPNPMLQQELKQQQIRSATQRVAGQLTDIITEFERNAIGGEDVKVLRAIRGVLGRLTEQDMQKVIRLLQQARELPDATTATRHATDAYAGQRSIITQLNQLVLEYQRQQALYELSLRFKEFADRQSANMWLGVSLAKETEGRTLTTFSESQESSLRVQQIDQENLREEIRMTLGKLDKLARDLADGPTADRPKLALEQARAGGLNPALDGAVEDLGTGKMLSATGNEKRARDQLREIARLLLLSQGEQEALRQALHEVEKAIDKQQAVADDTRQIDKDDTARVQPRQAELVDTTDSVRRDIQSLAPTAAERLKNAADQMQEARAVFNAEKDPKRQRQQAPPKQDAALASLEQARQSLQEQLARAEAMANTPANTLEALRDLQAATRQLAQDQEQLKTETAAADKKDLNTKAARQADLKKTAQALQQKAAGPSASAASSLGEAASQMHKAQSSLAAGQKNDAAQQAAQDALNQADQQLGQDIAQLEQAQQEMAQLEALRQRLLPIIDEQQQVQFGTAKAAAKPDAKAPSGLASRQDKLGGETGQLQQDSATPAPDAASHLGDAKKHMDSAKSELSKPAPQTARPEQAEALTDLHAARRAMENRINELRDKLGLGPMDNGQAMADAAAQIEKARREVDQAITQMQQAPPGLFDSLLQQQRQIASSLGEIARGGSDNAPVSQARQAADAAAQQLAQADLPKAVESMQAAQNALQQAVPDKPAGAPSPPQANGDPPQSLPQLARQQTDARQTAQALLDKLRAASDAALQHAEQSLDNAGSALSPVTAGELGPLPQSVQAALQSAEGSVVDGAAQAAAGQAVPAHAHASSAAWALAQAQAALALAQNGLGSQNMMAGNNQGQGQQKGQGQAQGQGQGQGTSQGPGKGAPGPQGNGRQGNWAGPGGAEGPRSSTAGPGQFTGLPARDRAAILQSQGEKYPQEYGPLVEQYLKNLADQAGAK